MVKRRTGGYDGRGQWIITESNQRDITDDLFGEVIAEKFIPLIMKCLSLAQDLKMVKTLLSSNS